VVFERKIDGEIDEWSCSACNVHVIFGLNDPPSYCPLCGAAMIVKGDGVNANSEYE
jgi:rubrerythrin